MEFAALRIVAHDKLLLVLVTSRSRNADDILQGFSQLRMVDIRSMYVNQQILQSC